MLARKLTAEFLGSLLLAGVVIGSGILASQMASGNDAVALLGNTAATAAILFVLITGLGPISGAHFNPAVTLAFLIKREIAINEAIAYILIQIIGCIAGAWLAHTMFEQPLLQISTTDRSGLAKMISEATATFALVFTILATLRWKPDHVPAAVAMVITAGYWWTASTSFANPAIAIARSMSDTFAGVQPTDLPGFIGFQCAGALLAVLISAYLFPKEETEA